MKLFSPLRGGDPGEFDAARFGAALLESLSDAVVACDRDGRVVVCNRRAQEIGGLATREGQPENWPPETPLFRALKRKRVERATLELRSAGGARWIVEACAEPVADAHGRVLGAVMVLHDVTDRVRAQEALRLQGAIAAEMAEGVVLVRAADGVIVYVNPAWERLFCLRAEEIVGRHISVVNAATDRTPEEQAAEIIGALERDGAWHGELQNVRPDGSRFWSEANVSTFEHPEHGPVWIAVHTDVTARKVADEERRAADERFRRCFEDGPLPSILADADGRLIDVNWAFCALSGYAREELVGKPEAEITHPDDQALDHNLGRRVFAGSIPGYRIEKRFVNKGGESVRTAVATRGVPGPDDRVLWRKSVVKEICAAERGPSPGSGDAAPSSRS